jgi:hypothetical protein
VKEETFVKILCIALKFLAWLLLILGIISSFALATAFTPLFFLTRWAGVFLLSFFILVFLSIYLIVKIAQMIVKIKKKVEA